MADSGLSLETIKNSYVDTLVNSDSEYEKEKGKRLYNEFKDSMYNPVYTYEYIHPESAPTMDKINGIASDIAIDLLAADSEIMAIADKYNTLIEDVRNRVGILNQKLINESNRLQSLNTIVSSYNYIDNAISIGESDLSGTYTIDNNGTITCGVDTETEVVITAIDVQGNGYAGNKYVIEDNEFISDYLPTDDLEYLTDGSEYTSFEYSRLYGQTKYIAAVNSDNIPALCSVTFSAESSLVNSIKIDSDLEVLIIKDILTSADNGKTFVSSFGNNADNGLNGYYSFPETNLFKIVFQSNQEYSEEFGYENTNGGITTMNDVRRKVISINGVTAFYNEYSSDSVFITTDLVADGAEMDTVSIYADEYIPSYFESNNNYITYTLIVNGEEYEVVPMNSNKSGTKYISYSYKYNYNDIIEHIDESIKALQLKITMTPYNDYATPYLTNLKLCFTNLKETDN
jgi:hypothetical protein